MKKKVLSVIVAIALCLSLAACGGSNSGTTTTATAGTTAADNKETQTTEAAGQEESIVTLTASSSFSNMQLVGIFWEYFRDKLAETSGGSIELDLYLGGTLGGPGEELSMLQSGSIDIMMSFVGINAFSVPTMCPLLYFPNDMETAEEIVYNVCYENETSSPIIKDNLALYNATILPFFQITSPEVWVTTKDITCWADLFSTKLGCVSDSGFSDMGYKNLVTINDTEWYESLRTGLVDTITCCEADVVTERLYEVGKSYLTRPSYRADEWMLINTDKWNSLSADQQDALVKACEETRQYAIDYQKDMAEQFESIVKENDGKIIECTDEENAWYFHCADELSWDSMVVGLGGATGYTDELQTVVDVTKEAFVSIAKFEFAQDIQPVSK